jgi:alpha-beta hydrolase superfamily lysophospholipase
MGSARSATSRGNDVAAAVAAVVGRPDLPVVVLGASMGAIAALRFAATTKEPLAGVVCISSPSAWRPPRTARGVPAAALTRTGLGRALAARYLRVRIHARWANPEPPQSLISRIAAPMAIIHGERDRFIPSSEAVELYEACRAPAAWSWSPTWATPSTRPASRR